MTPFEYKQTMTEAARAVLFESKGSTGDMKSKKMGSAAAYDDMDDLGSDRSDAGNDAAADGDDGDEAIKSIHIHVLSSKSVGVGLISLGIVKEIHDEFAVIQLPNYLHGYVLLKEVSDVPVPEENVGHSQCIISVGQFVRAVVIDVEHDQESRKKKIFLSLRPSLCNAGLDFGIIAIEGSFVYGYIRSIEDHGCIVDFGIRPLNSAPFSGFLPKNELNGLDPRKGAVLQARVSAVNTVTRVLTLSYVSPSSPAAASPPPSKLKELAAKAPVDRMSFDSFKPGLLLSTEIVVVKQTGLVVALPGNFFGTIDILNLNAPVSALEAPDTSGFAVGARVLARVLFVDSLRQRVSLSLSPTVLQMSILEPHPAGLVVGSKVEAATVVRKVKDTGIYVEKHGVLFFVHVSQLEESSIDKNDPLQGMAVGDPLNVRVLAFDHLGCDVVASAKHSVYNSPMLSLADVVVGSVVEGTVDSLLGFGALVALSDTVRGLVPNLHLSDASSSSSLSAAAGSHLKVGQKVKCRVLQCDLSRKKLFLSLKKTLVKSTLPQFLSYSDIREGMFSHGVIASVKAAGCIVWFFNDVHGLVPRELLDVPPGERLEAVFHTGRTMKCKVLSVDATSQRLLLSFNSTHEPSAVSSLLSTFHRHIAYVPGTRVAGVVKAVQQAGLLLTLETGGTAFLAFSHLTDLPTNVEHLSRLYKAGDRIAGMMVLDRKDSESNFHVTVKQTLLESQAAGVLFASHAECVPRKLSYGYVRSVTDSAVYVAFLGNVFGMLPKSAVKASATTPLPALFSTGQTLLVSVASSRGPRNGSGTLEDAADRGDGGNDEKGGSKRRRKAQGQQQQQRLVLRLAEAHAPSPLPGSPGQAFDYLSFLFAEHLRAAEQRGDVSSFSHLVPGRKIRAKVASLEEFGCMCSLPSGSAGVDGFVLKQHIPSAIASSIVVGALLDAIVLDIDMIEKVVSLSLDVQALLAKPSSSKKKKQQQQPQEQTSKQCDVLISRDDYAVVHVQEKPRMLGGDAGERSPIAYIPLRTFNCTEIAGVHLENGDVASAIVPPLESTTLSADAPTQTDGGEDPRSGRRLLLAEGAPSSDRCDVLLPIVAMDEEAQRAWQPPSVSIDTLARQQTLRAKVHSVQRLSAILMFSPCMAGILSVADVPGSPHNLREVLRPGMVVDASVVAVFADEARVVEHEDYKTVCSLTLRPWSEYVDYSSESASATRIAVSGHVTAVKTANNVVAIVSLPFDRTGVLSPVDCFTAEELSALPLGALPPGMLALSVQQGQPPLPLRFPTVGQRVSAFVVGGLSSSAAADSASTVILTRLPEINCVPGTKLVGQILQNSNKKWATVRIAHRVVCQLSAADVTDNAVEEPLASLKESQFVVVRVLAGTRHQQREQHKNYVDVSLRSSSSSTALLTVGSQVHGYVKSCTKNSTFLFLGEGAEGRLVHRHNTTTTTSPLEAGSLVFATVASVDATSGLVELSSSDGNSQFEDRLGQERQHQMLSPVVVDWSTLESGQVLFGRVKTIEKFGLFVSLDHSKLVGLVHISKLCSRSKNRAPIDLTKVVSTGQHVRVKVLDLPASSSSVADAEAGEPRRNARRNNNNNMKKKNKKRLELGMKAEYFDEPHPLTEAVVQKICALALTGNGDDSLSSGQQPRMQDSDDTSSNSGSDDEGQTSGQQLDDNSDGFKFGLVDMFQDDSDDDDDDGDMKLQPQEKKRKTAQRQQQQQQPTPQGKRGSGHEDPTANEQYVSQLEEIEASGLKLPETPAEFEKLLVSQPNSSFIWVQYMAFFLRLSQVDQARGIAERALESIFYREDEEKFNVWLAYLNLERKFGSSSTYQKLFQRAIQQTNAKKLGLRLVMVLSGKELDEHIQTFLLKRFRESCKVWLCAVRHAFSSVEATSDESQGAKSVKEVVKRALQAMPKHKHVKFLIAYAQMEYRLKVAGSRGRDRGRAVFEGLVAQHPKRLDIWSVYLDMEASFLAAGDDGSPAAVADVRRLFDRVISLNLSSKKVKHFFKRYLQFEKSVGSDEGVERVKQKARDFIASL